MLPLFTIFASQGDEHKEIPCDSAMEVVLKRTALIDQGWIVGTLDSAGMPVSEHRIDGLAKDEAIQNAQT